MWLIITYFIGGNRTFHLLFRYLLWDKRTLTRDTTEVSCFLEHPSQLTGTLVLLIEPVHLQPLRQKVVANSSLPQPAEFFNHLATGWGCQGNNCSFHCFFRTWPERDPKKKNYVTWPCRWISWRTCSLWVNKAQVLTVLVLPKRPFSKKRLYV